MSDPIPPRVDIPGGAAEPPRARWTIFHSLGIFLLGNFVIGQALIGTLIVSIFYGGVVQRTVGASSQDFVLTLFADLAMTATVVVWFRIRHQPVLQVVGVPERGRWVREIGIGIAFGVALYLVTAFGVSAALAWVVEHLSNGPVVAARQIAAHVSTSGKILAAFVAVCIAPPAEELFFRGVLFRGLRDRHGFWVAGPVSAALFGLAHFVPGEWRGVVILMASLGVTGFGLALLYDRRKNLVANIAAHATFNVIGIVFLFWLPKGS